MLLFSTCISNHQLIQSRKYVETFNERVKIKLQMCLGLKQIICWNKWKAVTGGNYKLEFFNRIALMELVLSKNIYANSEIQLCMMVGLNGWIFRTFSIPFTQTFITDIEAKKVKYVKRYYLRPLYDFHIFAVFTRAKKSHFSTWMDIIRTCGYTHILSRYFWRSCISTFRF